MIKKKRSTKKTSSKQDRRLSLRFPVDTKGPKDAAIKEFYGRLKVPPSEADLKLFAKEASSNSMTTPSISSRKIVRYWRPNNYRRKLRVLAKSDAVLSSIRSKPTITSTKNISFGKPIPNQHTKVVNVRCSNGVTLQYGKHFLTGIWSQRVIFGEKETFLLEGKNLAELNKLVDMRVIEVQDRIDTALFAFANFYGIKLKREVPVWDRYEDWYKGDSWTDNLSEEAVVHDTYFKKTYPTGFEFKQTSEKENPGLHMKHFIKNSIAFDFMPEIKEELEKLYRLQAKTTENVAFMAENMKSHTPAIVKLGVNAEKGAVSQEKLANAAEKLADIVEKQKVHTSHNQGKGGGSGSLKSLESAPNVSSEPSPLLCPKCGNLLVLRLKNLIPYCDVCGVWPS